MINMEQDNFDNLLDNEDIPEMRIEDEVPGAKGYVWDPVNKQWQPVFAD